MSRLTEIWHRLQDKQAGPFLDEFEYLLQGKKKTTIKEPPPVIPQRPPVPSWYGDNGRPIWLNKAISYVGLKEFPGAADNPIILNWARGTGGDTTKNYTHDSIPWCMLFAVAVIRESGLKYIDSLWALDILNWGVKLSGPVPGAVAAMKRNGGGHVTIVVGRDQNGNLMCVGGNQSDAVNIKPFDPERIVGYRWPSEVKLPTIPDFNDLPVIESDGKVSENES
jgi:uncharacterized protein (TIGR02594 family)